MSGHPVHGRGFVRRPVVSGHQRAVNRGGAAAPSEARSMSRTTCSCRSRN